MTYGRGITPEEISQWRTLYEAGMSGPQIAATTGRAPCTITRTLKRQGVELRPPIHVTQQLRGKYKPRPPWQEDWCDECCDVAPLNPRTGWCAACTNQPKRPKSPSDQSTKVST